MENKYCYCDIENDGNSPMAQLFFCEDWFHKELLNIFGVKKSEKKFVRIIIIIITAIMILMI